jgi:hypothetical protein
MRGTSIAALAITFTALLAAAPANAAGPACRVQAQPFLDLSFKFPPIAYERNRSRVQLSMQASGFDRVPTSDRTHTAGLTSYNEIRRAGVSGKVAKLANGTFCFMLTEAKVIVGYDTVTVAVDRNYPLGSCEYGAIFDHEERHVAIIKQAYLNEMPAIRSALQAALVSRGAAVGRTPKEAATRVKAQLEAMLRPHLVKVAQNRRAANAELDTPESYRRTNSLCSNW